MSERTPHEILSVKVLHDAKWLRLNETQYRYDNHGQPSEGTWLWVSRNDQRGLQCNAVVIAAIHVDELNVQRLVVTDEFRVPIEGREYGFPAGLVDKGMTAEDTVIKELWEECDLHVTKVLEVPTPIALSSAGMTNEAVRIFYCYCRGTPSRANLHPGEDVNTVLMDWKDIDELLKSGKPIGGKALGIMTQMWMQGFVGYNLPSEAPLTVVKQANRMVIQDQFGRELALLQSPAPIEVQVLDGKRIRCETSKPTMTLSPEE